MPGAEITGLSLNDVRKLIDDKKLPEDVLDAFNLIFGAVIALSPAVGGPAALPLLAALAPASALVDAGKAAIKRLTRPDASDYIDQATRFAAANTLLTYTAFFDAVRLRFPGLARELVLDRSGGKKSRDEALAAAREIGVRGANAWTADPASTIRIPRALDPADPSSVARHKLYQELKQCIHEVGSYLSRTQGQGQLTDLGIFLDSDICEQAEFVYQSEFLGMAIDYQPFFVWSALAHQESSDERFRQLGEQLRTGNEDEQLRFELLGAALHSVDQNLDRGFDRLARAISALPPSGTGAPRHPESMAAKAAEALRRRYTADVARPVIDDRYEPTGEGPRLTYPRRADGYIPQAYRQLRYEVGKTPLERDDAWAEVALSDDLGVAITRFLESPYSTETPLLILGHPGSGKSLLTRVYAARLSDPRYTVVRVELRDVDPSVRLQKQIEDQILKDTGYQVNFADLADNLPFSPPVVILDGYDELLQATGKLFTDYLDQVSRFQEDQFVQNRPVRVIVTSRVTLIDRAIIPPGTTVLRLEPFDRARVAEWTERWNECNAAYFDEATVRPFGVPDNKAIHELAEQPLLLLMLAIYDSARNQLSERPDLDQTLLYDELLRRFIERELGKGEHSAKFTGLPLPERESLIDRELFRLGVAAIGMFNRQEVKILRDQLDRDLAYFAAERGPATELYGQTQSDLLLGSFFFVHESRTGLALDGPLGPAIVGGTQTGAAERDATQTGATGSARTRPAGPAAFEFLHNTFGEFLAADFILRQVVRNAETIRDLSDRPTLQPARQQHLAALTPPWFACLLYTPLHTRPNILVLLREWSAHRLPADPEARAAFQSALDAIVISQLRAILVGTEPLDLAVRARLTAPGEAAPTAPPYDPLPMVGQVAVYTLNLILLRTYLAGQPYVLDEPSLDAHPRPWDRLTGLWRSWFPLESLGALASRFSATREGTSLTLASEQGLFVAPDSSLHTVFNVAIALADNLTAATAGLHVMSLTVWPERSFFDALLTRFTDETRALDIIAQSMESRLYAGPLSAAVRRAVTGCFSEEPVIALDLADVGDRLVLSPRDRDLTWRAPDSVRELPRLSRYAAELAAHSRAELDAHWLDWSLLGEGALDSGRRGWERFLASPAAAPVLRVAMRQLTAAQCARFARILRNQSLDRLFSPYDVDTAASLAVLAWRGEDSQLCLGWIDVILQQCSRRDWSPLDIPLGTWDGLADLFRTADPLVARARERFAALVDVAIESTQHDLLAAALATRQIHLIEFWIQALRIGVTQTRGSIMQAVIPVVTRENTETSGYTRRWFLLLLRWARENGEAQLITNVLFGRSAYDAGAWWTHFGAEGPEAIDLDRACQDLTYREAMDLRWALALQQPPASADQNRGPRPALFFRLAISGISG